MERLSSTGIHAKFIWMIKRAKKAGRNVDLNRVGESEKNKGLNSVNVGRTAVGGSWWVWKLGVHLKSQESEARSFLMGHSKGMALGYLRENPLCCHRHILLIKSPLN